MASAGPANPEQVALKVKTLINNQLKQILKKEGLPVSGAKAALQSRITDSESSVDSLVLGSLWKRHLVKVRLRSVHRCILRSRYNELIVLSALQNCSHMLATTI